MSGLASLAGYGSDSDDDADVPSTSTSVAARVASTSKPSSSKPSSSKPSSSTSASSSRPNSILPPPKSGLSSKLPPPSAGKSNTQPSGSGLSLPPPSSSTNKRKVIKVDSIQSVQDGNDDDDQGNRSKLAETKKPKLGSAIASKHSLFGMLPAPKRKDDEILAERKKEADASKAAKAVEDSETPALTEAPLRINERVARSASPEADRGAAEASTGKAKSKSNDAFRAMLGLKPAAKPAISKSSTSAQPARSTAESLFITQPSQQSQPSSRAAQTSMQKNPNGTPASGEAAIKTESAPVDFFSLGSSRSSANAPSSSTNPSFSISAAPVIDQPNMQRSEPPCTSAPESDEYPGWQLDPDGSWLPITPEAQAQYAAYQQSLLPPQLSTATISKAASNLDGTRDLLAAGLTPDDIRAFDASSAAHDAYMSSKGGGEGDSDKYAAAAEFAAGNREVRQERKPGMLKGLRKGQLSSLVSLASENRGKMEDKWQRGRDAQARRSNQYGW
ncbi:uncharacterized protein UDID_06681 [Ustilago sp. UG-2017a]|nr:uncharacterized protein UDID_06681 [Ustilago sp. UG-2017a]